MRLMLFILTAWVMQPVCAGDEPSNEFPFMDLLASIFQIGWDDPLDPAVQAIVFEEKVPNLQNNAWVYAWAFDVKTDDVYQTGLEILAIMGDESQYQPDHPDGPYPEMVRKYSRFEAVEHPLLCKKSEPICLDSILNQAAEAKVVVDQHSEQITRYLQLLNAHDRFETVRNMTFDGWTPDFRNLLDSQQLYHLQLLTIEATKNDALKRLGQEIKQIRKLLKTADYDTVKIVLTTMLNECIELLSQLHQKNIIVLTPENLSQHGITPLAQEEISHGLAMKTFYEARIRDFYDLFHTTHRADIIGTKNMSPLNAFMLTHFYQPNMSVNAMYHEYALPLIEANQSDLLSLTQFDVNPFDDRRLDFIRNPVGSHLALMLISYAIPTLEYQYRTFWLDHKIKLLIGLVHEGTANAVIAAAEQGDRTYLNPFDQSTPFIEAGRLCHSGHHEHNDIYRCLVLLQE